MVEKYIRERDKEFFKELSSKYFEMKSFIVRRLKDSGLYYSFIMALSDNDNKIDLKSFVNNYLRKRLYNRDIVSFDDYILLCLYRYNFIFDRYTVFDSLCSFFSVVLQTDYFYEVDDFDKYLKLELDIQREYKRRYK